MAVVSYSDPLYHSKPKTAKPRKLQPVVRETVAAEPKLRFSDAPDYLIGVAMTVLAVGGSAALFWFF